MTRCDDVHELLSARLDGELAAGELATLDRHLAGCVACRVHAEALDELERAGRLAAAEAVPDLTHRIMAAHHARSAEQVVPSGDWRRWALGVLGLTLAVMAMPGLLGVEESGAVHLSRELAAWDLALAASLLLVARRPERATGVFPLAAVVVVILAVTAFADAASGTVSLPGEAHHVLHATAVAVLASLTRSISRPRPVASVAA